jgi:hypothetical protein
MANGLSRTPSPAPGESAASTRSDSGTYPGHQQDGTAQERRWQGVQLHAGSLKETDPCLSLPMRLLETIGIGLSKEQLSREFASLKRDYKWLLMDMRQNLYIVGQRTMGMYEEELSAFAAKMRAQQNGSAQTKNLAQGADKKSKK